MKIDFSDLNGFLKTAVVGMWIVLGINSIAFLVAFIGELAK